MENTYKETLKCPVKSASPVNEYLSKYLRK